MCAIIGRVETSQCNTFNANCKLHEIASIKNLISWNVFLSAVIYIQRNWFVFNSHHHDFYLYRKRLSPMICTSKSSTLWTWSRRITLGCNLPIPIMSSTGWIQRKQSRSRSRSDRRTHFTWRWNFTRPSRIRCARSWRVISSSCNWSKTSSRDVLKCLTR